MPSWPTGTMPALVFTGPQEAQWQSIDIPRSEAGRVLIRIQKLGICGTDVHLFTGHSSYMRVGLTTFPLVPGHEWCGEVVAVGAGVEGVQIGDRVVGEPFLPCGSCGVCRAGRLNLCPNRAELGVRGNVPGAAAKYLSIPAANIAVVPENVPSAHAVLAEPSVTVLHSLSVTNLQAGERVAVIGTGTLGLIAVQVASKQGCAVDAIGIDSEGLLLAKQCGAGNTFGPEEAPSDNYDVVIEASGAAAALLLCSRIAGLGGRIAQAGITAAPSVEVNSEAVVSKGLSIHGVLGGIPHLRRALQLISTGTIDPALLIDAEQGWGQAGTAIAALLDGNRPRPKLIIDMTGLE
ncbi:zinc-binding dehydrogenase [Arthrobacter sp. GCM10027362]|uniref:zinc-dependent alcohol dehydrogenase n=1 Tax=Arthrobacter sp. GCM10027362 TaxID=3273379 RepID=UPI0036275311